MQFSSLKTTHCPHCKSHTVVYEACPDRRHVNGQMWERRKFACDYEVEWVPNMQREGVRYDCPKSYRNVERKKRRDELRNKLIPIINECMMEIPINDPDMKINELLRQVNYCLTGEYTHKI